MSAFCIEVLQIPLGNGFTLRLEDYAPAPRVEQPGLSAALPAGWTAATGSRTMDAPVPAGRPPFYYDASAPERGLSALRLFELREYLWEVVTPHGAAASQVSLTSSLEKSNENNDLWRPRKGQGSFSFVNYLGSAWIEAAVQGLPPVRISFDVASPKLDYEQEYRSMVESIGEECQQLLLEWGTPTTLNLIADPDRQAQTLLEQFLFLRHVLGPGKLELYLEVLQRRPHSRLETERNWKPAGAAGPSAVAADPLRHGRDWRYGPAGLVPGEVREVRKYDSLDTPPNRFLKFALQSFRNLCDSVLNARRGGKPVWNPEDTVCVEAASLQQSLDSFLALPLFDDVGELRRVPFESTVLQRREGYREILLAWLMLDAAAQIEWPGRGDVYDGTSRDVATLYEFWFYFVLIRAFKEDLGMVLQQAGQDTGALPFCCRADDGRLRINLKQGQASFCCFLWNCEAGGLRVHFYYNRSFGRSAVGVRGSYSKTFRPDYTLVIIPVEFSGPDAELNAEKAGRIAYLHFDAKYRGENLPGIFGAAEKEEDSVQDDRVRAAGSVKNADLYKMHTYNEAIRRTVGSYVIYPGIAAEPADANARFERYHELIPGIGAFALRPEKDGYRPAGLPMVTGFIRDILTHQLSRFTQSYRISSVTELVIREKPVTYNVDESVSDVLALPHAAAVMGYMRAKDVDVFREGNGGVGPYFYCRATGEDGIPLTLDISAAQGAFLIGWRGPSTGPFHTAGWVARVAACRLVTGKKVAAETGHAVSDENRLYLLFKLEDVSPMPVRDVTELVKSRNAGGKGGLFRAFQVLLKDVFVGSPSSGA